MWWAYLLSFAGGTLMGMVLMALMAASREPEKHEVHIITDEDGNLDVVSIPQGDIVFWHNKEVGEGGIQES